MSKYEFRLITIDDIPGMVDLLIDSETMGNGGGKKLMNEGHRIMREKGYNSIIADWRITNLTSSTFWPKCGFKPIAYRMARYIDSNLAWANFNNPSVNQL